MDTSFEAPSPDTHGEALSATIDRMVAQLPHFQRRLAEICARRTRTTFAHVPFETGYTVESQQYELQVALVMGVHRARLSRYLTARGLAREWMQDLRRQAGLPANRRQEDTRLVLEADPQFATFLCEPPLSDEEILSAAALEYRDQIAGPGTDYHACRSRRRVGAEMFACTTGFRQDGDAVIAEMDFPKDVHPLGEAYTRAASVAMELYGPSGVYWLASKLQFGGRQALMLKVLGGMDPKQDQREYWKHQRSLHRRFEEMDQRIVAVLRSDPHLRELYREKVGPLEESPKRGQETTTLEKEREQSRTRRLRRLREKLARSTNSSTMIQFDEAPYAVQLAVLQYVESTPDSPSFGRAQIDRISRMLQAELAA